MVNENGRLHYRSTELGLGNNSDSDPSQLDDADREGRSVLWYDADGDGVLEMTLLSTFTGRWLEQAGNAFVADTGTNYNCNRNQFAVLVDFTGDDSLEVICVSNGGEWVRRSWDV